MWVMAEINHALLLAGLLLFAALLLSAASNRLGVPALLVFLAVGLVATEIPGLPANPITTDTAALIGNLALAVILLDGGLRTRLATLKMVAAPALALATVGVALTAAVVGALATALLGFDWRIGLLLGAIVGSTDAAAVFAVLGSGGTRLNERVEATLEVESGLNDPMAVFLTLALIELLTVQAAGGDAGLWSLGGTFVVQLGLGLVGGLAGGWLLAEVVARARLSEPLYALLIQSGGLLIFAATNLAGGSGFLAIYLVGVVVTQRRVHVGEDVLRASDSFAWLAQAAMFLILGLFAQVEDLWAVGPQALLIAVGLIVVARPLAVAACLLPFRYSLREVAFIGWTGLRGAVPIVLALLPLLAGLPQAPILFAIAFFSVLLSLVVQGMSLPLAARLSGVDAPASSSIVSSALLVGAEREEELVQILVAAGAAPLGRAAQGIAWPSGARLVELRRGAERLPLESPLAAGDVLTVIAPPDQVADAAALFQMAASDGEFPLAAGVTLADLRDAYGVTLPATIAPEQPVVDYVAAQLRGRAVVGDTVQLGALRLTVRRAQGGRIAAVGLRP
jgi:cell volume regulation protein A